MRKALGLLLVLVGAFAVVLAILLPTVGVSKSKKTPLDLDITQISNGTAKLYDADTGQTNDVTLRATRLVRTDSSASDSDNTTVNESLCIVVVRGDTPNCVRGTDPRLLDQSTDRVTADRKTAESVHVPRYRENVDGDTSVRHTGLSYKFPIDTEKKTYQFFLPDLKRAFPATYVGEDEIRGLKVYKFESKTGVQKYRVQGTFPGTYEDTRTVWVEPRTGAIVNGEETQVQKIIDTRTNETITALDAKLAFSKGAIDFQSNYAKDKIDELKLAQLWAPIVMGVVGIVALVGAFLLLRGRRSAPGDSGGSHRDEPLHPDSGPGEGQPRPADPNEQTRPVGTLRR